MGLAANEGSAVRAFFEGVFRLARPQGENKERVIFDSGKFGIDWSQYNAGEAQTLNIAQTASKTISLANMDARVLYIETDAPIEITFTQDGEPAQTIIVSPLVEPDDWFTDPAHSPSQKPTFFQSGFAFLTLSPRVTALSIANNNVLNQAANVIVAFAGKPV